MRTALVVLAGACLCIALAQDGLEEDFGLETEGTDELDTDDLRQFDEEYDESREQPQKGQRKLTEQEMELERRFQTEFFAYLQENLNEECMAEVHRVMELPPEEQRTLENPFSEPCVASLQAAREAFQPDFIARIRKEYGHPEQVEGEQQSAPAGQTAPIPAEEKSKLLTVVSALGIVGAAVAGVFVWASKRHQRIAEGKKNKPSSGKKAKKN